MKRPSPLLAAVLIVAFSMVAAMAITQFTKESPNTSEFNKSQVLNIVERGANQDCEWESYSSGAGKIDCLQEFEWKNQSYKVHDYFQVNMVNGAVEITQ